MKKRKWSIILSLFAVLGIVAWSPGVTEDLVIGSSNLQFTSPNGVVGVVGSGNKGVGKSSFIVGENNQISHDSQVTPTTTSPATESSIIAGTSNILMGANSRNLVTGESNTVAAVTTLVSGYANTVQGVPAGTQANHSAAIGALNNVTSVSGWAIGSTNGITGDKSAAIGSNLVVSQPNSVAVGAWNGSMATGDVFVVGNGKPSTPSTALRVTSSGEVILSGNVSVSEAQGDISMGDYE